MCKSVGSTNLIAITIATECAGMNRLVATLCDHRWWTMQNAMMSLLLAISNGLCLKSVGCCFQLLKFQISAIYST